MEHLILADCKILSADSHYSVYGWHDNVHIGVQVRGRCDLAVQKPCERLEHRHDCVNCRHQVDNLFCCDILEIDVKSGFEVLFAPCRVERIQTDVPCIGNCLGISDLNTSFLHKQPCRGLVDFKVGVSYVFCIHADIGLYVARNDNQ